MKKILILIPSLKNVGGAEKLVDSLSTLLAAKHQVFQASFDAKDAKRHFENPAPYFPLGELPRLPLFLRWITYFILAFKLASLKRRLDIDITLSNLWGADLISALSPGRDKKISLVLINIRGNHTNRLMMRFRKLVGIVYRRFDRVLAISRPLQLELSELYKLPDRKLGTFRNFLNVPEPHTVWQADGIRRYVFCGRLVHEKNLDGLLLVWADFAKSRSNVQLVVIGDGPLAKTNQELAADLNLKIGFHPSDIQASVLFLGVVAQPENIMAGAQAFLLPSRHEGVPTVLLLAAALHLPILASDCHSGGVRDMLGVADDASSNGGISVSSGMLLPIPEGNDHSTIEAWLHGLQIADTDAIQHEAWRKGAAELSVQYSPESVSNSWMTEIEKLCHS